MLALWHAVFLGEGAPLAGGPSTGWDSTALLSCLDSPLQQVGGCLEGEKWQLLISVPSGLGHTQSRVAGHR